MDGDVLSLSSFSSLSSAAGTQKDTSPKSDSNLPQNQQEHKSAEELWLLSTEEQVTLITESMSVTSTDQEKLLLLNKNTELRRVNKELMKLNEDWDQVYRSATLGLQHRLEALELENTAIKQLNSRLLLKVEHQQGSFSAVIRDPASCSTSNPPGGPNLSHSHVSGYNPSPSFFPASPSPEAEWQGKSQSSSTPLGALGDSRQEVQDLKEQLEALRCQQTQIYEAEYETEHNDHKHTLQENRRLRKKREEMRQQVALLQEQKNEEIHFELLPDFFFPPVVLTSPQLKVYEDDFRRERSDKQMLQRLLMKKTPPHKDPVLVHRCNNEQQPLGGDKRTQSGEKRKQHHPLCPKHLNRDKESD
ncbi:hypothetical protein GBF38_008235 [Nibea albiflora]|uniref:Uncharacterized protein n=1 Tax=Nibea albiflora TaxID=240163 RepID=A0ACB7EQP4_NIBAL|nr:hypothetical protein GBF38_008235 [Nibea albiflora]